MGDLWRGRAAFERVEDRMRIHTAVGSDSRPHKSLHQRCARFNPPPAPPHFSRRLPRARRRLRGMAAAAPRAATALWSAIIDCAHGEHIEEVRRGRGRWQRPSAAVGRRRGWQRPPTAAPRRQPAAGRPRGRRAARRRPRRSGWTSPRSSAPSPSPRPMRRTASSCAASRATCSRRRRRASATCWTRRSPRRAAPRCPRARCFRPTTWCCAGALPP